MKTIETAPAGALVHEPTATNPPDDTATEFAPPAFKLENILVPIDFSKTSEKALRYAVPFAKQFGAKITLVNVIDFPIFPQEIGIPVVDEFEIVEGVEKNLAELAARMVAPELLGKTIVRRGAAWESIVTEAREMPADLIITTTHGYTGLKHVFVGSTAELVVRRAPCPVLVVREKEHEFA